MPLKSEQQRKFMAMCLHNPEKAKDNCPPKSVAKKFIHGHKRTNEMNYHYFNFLGKFVTALTEAGMLMTPEMVKDKSLPSKGPRIRKALKKIQAHGEGEEGQAGPMGAVATMAAILRAKGAGKPTGREEGSDEGSPQRGKDVRK